MALLFCDSFDHYTTAQASRKWDTVGNVAIGAFGRNSTSGAHIVGNVSGIGKNLSVNAGTLIAGVAVRFNSASVVANFLRFYDTGTLQVGLRYNVDGSVSVLGPAGGVLGTSAPAVVTSPTAVLNHFGIVATFHDTTGAVTVYVNTIAVLTLTNVDTKATGNAYANQVNIGEFTSNGQECFFDDFYVCDTTGSTNNTVLGDVRVECKFPDAAGTTANMAAVSGANYTNTDDNPANDDTDYVSSSVVGDKDTYNFAALTSTTGAVLAVAVNLTDRKDDSGSRTHAALARLSGTEVAGTAYAPTTSYAIHQTIFETKPGGGAWTISDVNSAEFGHKISA